MMSGFKSTLLLLFTVLSTALLAQQENIDSLFTNFKFNIASFQNPVFLIQNVGTGSGTRSNNRWIKIELSYNTTGSQSKTNNLTIIGTQKHSFRVYYQVIIPGIDGTYLLSTNINYAGVKINNKIKYALVLVPPQILNSLLSSRQQLNSNYFRRLNIKATFYVNNQEAGIAYHPKTAEQAFERLSSGNEITKIPGGLLKRTETPWITIGFDKYEIIKSN